MQHPIFNSVEITTVEPMHCLCLQIAAETTNKLSSPCIQTVCKSASIFVALHAIELPFQVQVIQVEFTGGTSDLYYLQLTNQIAIYVAMGMQILYGS